jgi:hypothetical protein
VVNQLTTLSNSGIDFLCYLLRRPFVIFRENMYESEDVLMNHLYSPQILPANRIDAVCDIPQSPNGQHLMSLGRVAQHFNSDYVRNIDHFILSKPSRLLSFSQATLYSLSI